MSTFTDLGVSEINGKSSKLRKVQSKDYVWMVHPSNPLDICAWVHPDETAKFLGRGYVFGKKTPFTYHFTPKMYAGRPIFVLGNSPTLTPEIGRKLINRKDITIGVNEVYRLFPDSGFAPTVHVHVDTIRDIAAKDQGIFKLDKESFGVKAKPYLDKMRAAGTLVFAPIFEDGQTKTIDGDYDYYATELEGFTSDYNSGILKLANGNSSIFQALQLAVILGGNPILLVGVDFCTPGYSKMDRQIHFYDLHRKLSREDIMNLQSLGESFEFHLAKYALPVLEEKGIKVFNLGKNSKLDIFKKVEISEWL